MVGSTCKIERYNESMDDCLFHGRICPKEEYVSPITAYIIAYVISTFKPWLECHGFTV